MSQTLHAMESLCALAAKVNQKVLSLARRGVTDKCLFDIVAAMSVTKQLAARDREQLTDEAEPKCFEDVEKLEAQLVACALSRASHCRWSSPDMTRVRIRNL